MANRMLMPNMLSKMVLMWLPSDAVPLAWEDPLGDVFVQWHSRSFIQIKKADRLLSMDDVEAIYKPIVDAVIIDTWTLVEDPPRADQWSAEEMARGLGAKPYAFNRLSSRD